MMAKSPEKIQRPAEPRWLDAFFAFDLIELNGKDRRERLKKIAIQQPQDSTLCRFRHRDGVKKCLN
jgi:hypothetical protein